MLKRLFQYFSITSKNTSSENIPSMGKGATPNVARPAASPIPVYPPVDTGIELVTVESILESQAVMMLRLRRLAGGKDESFDRYYLAIVTNLAAYIQLLPASNVSTHNGAGGLFRLCLELAFFSLQSGERIVFAVQEGIELSRELEPRWRYATFITGLCAELYRLISEMVITDVNGNVWPKYLKSITQWGNDTQIERYFVQWHKSPSLHSSVSGRADVAIIMKSILPDYCFQYLEEFNSQILPIVFAVASGSSHPSDSPIAKIVSETRRKIEKRDEATRKERYGQLTVGNHLEPYLLDAMRNLVSKEIWLVNKPKSRLWYCKEGLFIIWKSGAKELLAEMQNSGIVGVPNNITTLAEILCESQICTRNGKELLWLVIPEGATDNYQAIKIANPLSLIEDLDLPLATIKFVGIDSSDTLFPPEIKQGLKLVESVKVEKEEKTKPPIQTTASPIADLFSEDVSVSDLDKIEATPKAKKSRPTSSSQLNLLAIVESPDTMEASSDVIDHTTKQEKIQIADAPRTIEKLDPAELKEETGEILPHQNSVSSKKKKEVTSSNKSDATDTAEIAPATPSLSSYATLLNERARKVLKPDMAEVIGKMIDDYKREKAVDAIFVTPNGIAYELSHIQRYGIATDKLLGLLHSNGWLVTPEENKEKKLMMVPNKRGTKVSCIVLNHDSCAFLGFTSDAS